MFPALLHFFWLLLQSFTAFSLLVPAILCLLYFAHRFVKKPMPASDELHEEKDYAIIVSVCETTNNLPALLQSLLQLHYSNYMIYVVGRQSAISGVTLCNDRIVHLRTTVTYHNNALLHRFAIENFKRPHTHVALLDSNSLVDRNYLTNLNTFFNQGFQAVKSCESLQHNAGFGSIIQTVANLYRNFFGGETTFSLGSSSALSGVGMAFSVTFYKQCLKRIKINGADFAPNLQAAVIQSGRQVAFASRAVVYNTVEASYYQLVKQHAQNIHNWLFCLLANCRIALTGMWQGDVNKMISGFASLRLPLPTAAFVGIACLIVNLRIAPIAASFWAGILLLLPVYLVIAAVQLSGNAYQPEAESENREMILENILLLEEENNYEAIMQTV